jgi:hypothetical protein
MVFVENFWQMCIITNFLLDLLHWSTYFFSCSIVVPGDIKRIDNCQYKITVFVNGRIKLDVSRSRWGGGEVVYG